MNAPTPISQAAVADVGQLMQGLGRAARAAAKVLTQSSTAIKNAALTAAAAEIRRQRAELLAANRIDVEQATQAGLSSSMLDRLTLNDQRIEAMARGIEDIVALPDPIGTVITRWTRPNGLRIERVRVPLGVVGIIYESRPNVTADAGALCLKSGNAVILRGGKESINSTKAIHACLIAGLRAAGLPEAAIQIVPTTDRAAVGYMLSSMKGVIDVVVPRGGRSLVERVQSEARVPVIGHLEGNCHVYVDRDADVNMARDVVVNAKLRRTGVCGAAETVLFDAQSTAAAPVLKALLDAGCEVRGDAMLQSLDARIVPASEQDWYTEYLEPIIAAKTVSGVDEAMAHIAKYGSAHTESIITSNATTAERFLGGVDSAIVLHNASTQFADGGEFGMGAEIGISTDKFHARGPVGVEQLTSYKYVVRGTGQTRP
jgi:glutamate-5-semialdehyde dehydrogenase